MSVPAPTFDYTPGLPWVPTDRWDEVVEEALDADRSVADALANERVRALREDTGYRTRLRSAFDDAGLNLLSVTLSSRSTGLSYAESIRRDLYRWQAMFDAVDWLQKVTGPERAREIVASGDVGVVLNTQNLGAAIEGDLSEIDALYDAGLRVAQLTYNRQNLVGTGCIDRSGGGLSTFGASVVERLNDLGIVVDCSHCNRPTTLDAVDVSRAPVAATHVACAGLADHPRAKSDAELDALAPGGYVGIVAVPGFAAPDRPDAPLDVFYDHLEYAADRVGVEHVGIGSDFANVDAAIPDAVADELVALALDDSGEYMWDEDHRATELGTGWGPLETFTDWPVLADGMRRRFSPEPAQGILGENFVEFWERVTARRE